MNSCFIILAGGESKRFKSRIPKTYHLYKNKPLILLSIDKAKNYGKFKKNPATKTFQAIRIFVNKELTELIIGLIEATKLLSNEGILIVVSFH